MRLRLHGQSRTILASNPPPLPVPRHEPTIPYGFHWWWMGCKEVYPLTGATPPNVNKYEPIEDEV